MPGPALCFPDIRHTPFTTSDTARLQVNRYSILAGGGSEERSLAVCVWCDVSTPGEHSLKEYTTITAACCYSQPLAFYLVHYYYYYCIPLRLDTGVVHLLYI